MILNYTTKIDAQQTIGEIQKMLSRHGITALLTEYDGPHVSAVSFKIGVDGKPMGFKLPCNWNSVYEIFTKKAGTRIIWDDKRRLKVLEERK